MNSLQGMFLIATNQMVDPRFKETVILICNHDKHGALGLVLTNIYHEIIFADILVQLNIARADIESPQVFCGGPVSLDALFVLHSQDLVGDSYHSTKIMDGVFLGNDLNLLSLYVENSNTYDDFRFFLGYSGWGPGQLEQELGFDGWLVLPAESADVFGCSPDLIWRHVTQKYGIDISLFNDVSGNA